MKSKSLFSLVFCLCFSSSFFAQEMNNTNLQKIIYVMSDTMAGENGAWEFLVGDVKMICLTDETHNRMRIIAPIAEMKDITEEEISAAMEANFHSALDVRYAISDQIMWSAFIHPLRELSKNQVIDAISQVYSSTLTFGTAYTSTDLVFPNSNEDSEKY